MPVLHHSVCCCQTNVLLSICDVILSICDVIVSSLSWVFSASVSGYHSLHFCQTYLILVIMNYLGSQTNGKFVISPMVFCREMGKQIIMDVSAKMMILLPRFLCKIDMPVFCNSVCCCHRNKRHANYLNDCFL